MLEELRKKVYAANMELPKRGLVTYTWGNVSGIDREKNLFVIKPSGVDYEKLTPEDLVIVDLEGNVVEGNLRPSSDTETHRILYREFKNIGGIAHTHSTYATSWAQACRDIPSYGTTHADYFYGEIPCTRGLTKAEIEAAYELNTGKVIVETFERRKINPVYVPAVICAYHGPFTWGKDAAAAVYHSVVLEELAHMATLTELNNPKISSMPHYVLDKHFMRQNGPNAYYGQENFKAENFYCKEIDEEIFARIDGKSYKKNCPIPLSDLRYLHVLHKNLRGEILEGELICNAKIAEKLLEIFKKLYAANYPIEKIRLIDEYEADDELSMRDNNSSCFNFRHVSFTDRISLHGYGMAIDINPLYNPYIKVVDGKKIIAPDNSADYEDREKNYPYKIEAGDLCHKLFTEQGFSWGGTDLPGEKDYQHFFIEGEYLR